MKELDDILSRATNEMFCTVNQAMVIEFCVYFVYRGMKENGFFSETMKKVIFQHAGTRVINELNNLMEEQS